MSIAEFYIENGIDPGDPASFDAWMVGHERGSMDGGWEYAGQKAAQRWKEEAEEEARMMAKEQAIEVARGRLQREQPHLSRIDNIRLAEAEAENTWKDYIDMFRADCGLDSDSEWGDEDEVHGVAQETVCEQQHSGSDGSGKQGGSSSSSGGSFTCSACNQPKPAAEFSKNQLSKGATKRRCVACVSGNALTQAACGKRAADSKQTPSHSAKRPAHDAADFESCSASVPREERLARLRSIFDARESLKSYDADFPSVYISDQGFSMDKATYIPEDWMERAALAKGLVDYGEAVSWSKKEGGYWTVECSGKPSGPPVVADLVELATKSGGRYSRETAVNAHAIKMLMLKGLMYRQDLLAGNPAQAGPGLYGFRDPPLVKYARVGSAAMVALLTEFGAELEQCLLWNEDHGYKDFNWRGDTALLAAAKEGHNDVCWILLTRGAKTKHTSMYDEDCSDKGAAAAARRCGQTQTAALIESFSPSAPTANPSVTALLASAHEAAQALGQTPRAFEFSASLVQGPTSGSSAGAGWSKRRR